MGADPDAIAREAAAAAAAALVEPGMTVGLGSGRAVWRVTELLAERGAPIRAVVGSEATRRRAAELGLEIVELDGATGPELVLDGADEVDPGVGLLKGAGGALLREKILVSAARRFVAVAEVHKRVRRLGERHGLPVEVVRFGWRDTRRRLSALLPDPEPRAGADGEPFVTDEGHLILDCGLPESADQDRLELELGRMPGVVEHGLFRGMAERALLGRPDGGVEVVRAHPS